MIVRSPRDALGPWADRLFMERNLPTRSLMAPPVLRERAVVQLVFATPEGSDVRFGMVAWND